MKTNLPYIVIIVLISIVLLQNRSCKPVPQEPIIQIDTLYIYKTIRDTIPGEVKFLRAKIDTSIWMKKEELKPDTTYKGLLSQYELLGNQHFAINEFSTEFKIADYGSVIVKSEVKANWLISNELETFLNIPTTIITIKETIPDKPKNQLYIGGELTSMKSSPLSGAYAGMLLKTKNDRIYGASIGYRGETELKVSSYWKIKLK